MFTKNDFKKKSDIHRSVKKNNFELLFIYFNLPNKVFIQLAL